MKNYPACKVKTPIMIAADDNLVISFLDFWTKKLEISCESSAGLLGDSLELSVKSYWFLKEGTIKKVVCCNILWHFKG